MMQSPVTGGYPGKYVCFAFVAFSAAMLYRVSRSAIQIIKEQRKNAAQSISLKPDAKKSVGGHVFIALVSTYMLAMALAVIYRAWPN